MGEVGGGRWEVIGSWEVGGRRWGWEVGGVWEGGGVGA